MYKTIEVVTLVFLAVSLLRNYTIEVASYDGLFECEHELEINIPIGEILKLVDPMEYVTIYRNTLCFNYVSYQLCIAIQSYL